MKEPQRLETGTTTVGIKGANCVVLAADMKATMGSLAADLRAQKIYLVNNWIAVTMAGGQGDSQTVIRYMKAHANLYEMEREKPLSPKAAITYLANILSANRYYPFMSFFLLGGYDKKPEIYSTDLVGGFSEVRDFTSTGSGSELALGVLEENYEEGLEEERAIGLAVNAIKVSRKRDIYTGGEGIMVVVIDSRGARELPESEVKKYLGEREKVQAPKK